MSEQDLGVHRGRGRAALRPRLPAGARGHAAAELAATRRRGHAGRRSGCDGGVRGARRGAPARRSASVRVVDRGDDRAVGGGRELLPEDLRRRRGRAVDGAHPDVRLARGRDRDEDGRAPGAEAGRRRRGPGDRGRVRLQAVRAGAGDVHGPRRRRRADRRQRRLPARPGRPLPRRPAGRLAAGRGRSGRSPQALRDRRRGRVDGWRGHRGPLRERRLPRRDGAGHRRCRPAGAGGVPDELPRARRAASVPAVVVLPGAGRPRLDARSRSRR